MNSFLVYAVVLLLLIVIIGYFNEKVTKFTYEISLMLFSVVISMALLLASSVIRSASVLDILNSFQKINLEAFLLDGVLCFMLFAGSCHARLLDFKKHSKIIGLLSIGATFLGAVFYGLLFYAVVLLFHLPLTLPVCLMLGSIVAPTDPIAATSILKKFNLPKDTGFIIEGESLLNDGVGVALFVCFSGMVTAEENGGFFTVMIRELFGAVLVGLAVSSICFLVLRGTKDQIRRIFTSLLAVSASYLLCEYFGFSGAVASVVCGVMFSAFRNYEAYKGNTLALEQFDGFWEILDSLLNSLLYVMLGLSFPHILQMPHVFLMSCVAIVINLMSRSGSVGAMSLLSGKLPDGYDKPSFIKLLTWGGLRGGLSVALAMSTRPFLESEVYYSVLGCTYAIVFFTTIVQGMTMSKVYQRIEKKRRGHKVSS